MFLAGQDEFLPPHLDSVVEALAEAGAIDAFEAAARLRCGCPFLGRHGHPDLVAALEVREAMMGDVMAHVPERERRQRRQEGDAADDLVEPVVLGVAAVTGVMADDEQPRDGDGRRNDHERLGPPGSKVQAPKMRRQEKRDRSAAAAREEPSRGACIPAWRRARSCGHPRERNGTSGVWGTSVISRPRLYETSALHQRIPHQFRPTSHPQFASAKSRPGADARKLIQRCGLDTNLIRTTDLALGASPYRAAGLAAFPISSILESRRL